MYEDIQFIYEGIRETDLKVVQWSPYLTDPAYQKNLRTSVRTWLDLCLWTMNYKEIPYNLHDLDSLLVALLGNFDNFISLLDVIFSIKS